MFRPRQHNNRNQHRRPGQQEGEQQVLPRVEKEVKMTFDEFKNLV